MVQGLDNCGGGLYRNGEIGGSEDSLTYQPNIVGY